MLNLELGHPQFCRWVRQTVKVRLQCRWKRAQRWVRVVEAKEYLQGATLEVTVLGGHGRCGVGQQIVAKNTVAEGCLDMLHGVVGAKVNSVVVRLRGGVVDPLSPVFVDLLRGVDVNNKGVRVPGLGGEPRVEERIVHSVPTMVL